MLFRPSMQPTHGNVARAGVAPQESHRRATGGGGWVNNADTMLAAELAARLRSRGLKIEQVPQNPADIDQLLRELGYTSIIDRLKITDLAMRYNQV